MVKNKSEINRFKLCKIEFSQNFSHRCALLTPYPRCRKCGTFPVKFPRGLFLPPKLFAENETGINFNGGESIIPQNKTPRLFLYAWPSMILRAFSAVWGNRKMLT